MRVYDPRDNTWKESDNPALILLYIELISCCALEDCLWEFYKEWANYCDEEVNTNESKTN